mmetsp:Transcript_33417/g.92482  ORF Transcript_33417/g.92482 Transcript_33417/m.92482 type:complete len:244 (+) Transcript_33417:83-814(+)
MGVQSPKGHLGGVSVSAFSWQHQPCGSFGSGDVSEQPLREALLRGHLRIERWHLALVLRDKHLQGPAPGRRRGPPALRARPLPHLRRLRSELLHRGRRLALLLGRLRERRRRAHRGQGARRGLGRCLQQRRARVAQQPRRVLAARRGGCRAEDGPGPCAARRGGTASAATGWLLRCWRWRRSCGHCSRAAATAGTSRCAGERAGSLRRRSRRGEQRAVCAQAARLHRYGRAWHRCLRRLRRHW